MARYRKIDPRIWNDAKFSSLSDNGKLMFFMLLTHPSMTSLGAMRATLQGLAAEMKWAPEAFAEAFAEASSKGMAEYDEKACLIALPKFIQYNPPESPNVVKAWVGALDLLPECNLKTLVVARAKGFAEAMGKGFAEALPEAFAKGMPYQEQEQEQEQKEDQKQQGGSAAAEPPLDDSEEITSSRAEPIPYQAIVDAYNQRMTQLAKVRLVNGQRRTAIRRAWHSLPPEHRKTGAFKAIFAECAMDDFLNGSGPYTGEHANWRPDFDHLIKIKTLTKVYEKAMARRELMRQQPESQHQSGASA